MLVALPLLLPIAFLDVFVRSAKTFLKVVLQTLSLFFCFFGEKSKVFLIRSIEYWPSQSSNVSISRAYAGAVKLGTLPLNRLSCTLDFSIALMDGDGSGPHTEVIHAMVGALQVLSLAASVPGRPGESRANDRRR